jgi:3D (Asp-Asp-Asp) domain-containing protein
MRFLYNQLFFGLISSIVALASWGSAPAHAESIYALLNNDPSIGQQLITFDSNTGAVNSTVVLQTANTISPLASIDVRPSTGQLYGFDATQRQLFTINPTTGALTAVGSPLPMDTLVGGAIDFNPTVDLIRLIGTGTLGNQNLRLNPITGVIAGTDISLSYSAGDSNQGDTPNIRANGYTNSVSGATMTTLYNIDVDNDVLTTQTTANSGMLQTVGTGLGVNLNGGLFGTFVGFDISGTTNTAYLTDGGFGGPSNFYTVNLMTGVATSQGTITGLPAGRTVADIAVANAIPEPTTLIMIISLGAIVATRRIV